MKTNLSSTRNLPWAVLLLTTSFAASVVAAPHEFLIHGSLEAAETHVVSFPTITIDLDGVGCAAHLGRFTLHLDATVNIPTRTAVGTAEFLTECGGRLFASVTGLALPTANPNESSIAETYTITGGTGRFAGATGSITIVRIVDSVTLTSTGTVEGALVLSAHRNCGRGR